MFTKGPILSIEDDPDDQFLIKTILTEFGIDNELLFFENGKVALEFLLETPKQPFLILCDVNMPLMNGIELHKAIADNDFLRKKAIPFVFLTTAANASLVNQAYFQSVQGFYQKASTYEGLRKQLQSILDYWQGCLHPNSYLPIA